MTSLSLFTTTRHTPISVDLLAHLRLALEGRGWLSARVLAHELGTTDRALRQAASLSAGAIVSGPRGYCLTREASVEDVRHCVAMLRSQAARMVKRAAEIDQAIHRG